MSREGYGLEINDEGDIMRVAAQPPSHKPLPASEEAWRKFVDGLDPEVLELLRSRQTDSTAVLLASTANAAQTQSDRSRAKAVSEKLDPLLNLVNRYSGAAKFAAQFAPAPASLVVDGINCVVTMPKEFLKYQKRVSERLVQMGKKFFVLNRYYDDLYSDDEDLQEMLIRVYISIITFCLEAAKLLYNKKGGVRSTAKIAALSVVQSFEDSVLGPLSSKFDDEVAYFEDLFKGAERRSNARAQQDTARKLGNVQNTLASTNALASQAMDGTSLTKKRLESDLTVIIRELKDLNQKKKNRLQILEYLDPINFRKDHEYHVKNRLQGTGGWLLEHEKLRDWDETENASISGLNTLYVQGGAGTGKSYLASAIVDYFSDVAMESPDEIAVAYVYCNSNDDRKINPERLLSSILHQFCHQASAEAIDRALRRTLDKRIDDAWTGEELGQAIADVGRQFTKCYILIDGLDECRRLEPNGLDKYSSGDEAFEDFCMTLRRLADQNSAGTRLAIFSRPGYDAIGKAFNNCGRILVDSGSNDADIQRYISSVLYGGKMRVKDTKILEEAEEKLIKGANGTFLWASLVLKDLQPLRYPTEFRAALDKLPKKLDDIYHQSLLRIQKASRSPKPFEILLWLANAKRPLSRAELGEALAIEPSATSLRGMWTDDEGLESECADLIILHDDCFTLIHSSLKDYLKVSASLHAYLDLQQKAHLRLGRACITYLMFDSFRTGPLDTRAEADEMIRANPFFEYAATYWSHHVRDEGDGEDELYEEVNALVTCMPVRDLILQYHHKSLSSEFSINEILYPFASDTRPIHLVALANLVKTAEKLTNEDRSVQAINGLGCLALDYAMLGRSREMALWILGEYEKLRVGGQLSTLPKGACNVPALAAKYDQGDVISRLVSVGFNVGQRGSTIGDQPLHVAAKGGCQSALELLLRVGVPVDCEDEHHNTALLLATRANHQGVIDTLINAKANIHHCGRFDVTALHYGSFHGNLAVVERLLDLGAEVQPCAGPFAKKQSPIHFAAEANHASVIEMLANPKYKCDIDKVDSDGHTPLLIAVVNDSLESTKMLVKLGAKRSVHAANDEGSLLHFAASRGNIDMVDFLLNVQHDLLYTEDVDKDTPLHAALFARNANISKRLLAAGANPHAKNNQKQTPLHLTIGKDLFDIAKILITEYHADVNDRGNGGLTQLHFAAYFGRANFIRLFVEEGGADPEALGDGAQTPFLVAAGENQLAFIQELLEVAPRIDLQRLDKWGQNAMHLAACNGGLELMQFLAERGVSRSLHDFDGDLPLHAAASGGHSDCIGFLVDNSSLDEQGFDGMTPLHSAVTSGDVASVSLLLDHGANPDITSEGDRAPLTAALLSGDISIATLLLDHGANPKICDAFGESPLLAAAELGNRDICDRLLREGCDGLQSHQSGDTAFAMAVRSGNDALLERFLVHGQNDCCLKNRTGESVFHCAASAGNVDMFKRLMQVAREAGADLEFIAAPEIYGATPLTYAARYGHVDVLEELLSLGFEINGPKGSVISPLIEAVDEGHVPIVAALVAHGADIECTGSKGETPISLAAQSKFPRIFNILRKAGGKPWRLDMFGMSALDYAKRSPAVWDALDGSLKDMHQPLPSTQRSAIIRDAIRRAVGQILQLPQPMDETIALQRLRSMVIVTDGLKNIGAEAEMDWLTGLKELHNISPTRPFSAGRTCALCGEVRINQAAFYVCRDCVKEPSCYWCECCYEDWHGARDTQLTEIPALKILEDLEAELAPIYLALAGYTTNGARVMLEGLELGTTAKNWIEEKQAQYRDWDKNYNSDSRFRRRMPGRKFLEIVERASQTLAEQVKNERRRGTAHSGRLGYGNCGRRETGVPTTPRVGFEELDEKLEQLFRHYPPDREVARFECFGHRLYKVPLDIEWAEDNTMHGPFDDTGCLTRDWLEGLLQRYSSTSTEDQALLNEPAQPRQHISVGSMEGRIDQASPAGQRNITTGSATGSQNQTTTILGPPASPGTATPPPIRRPTTIAETTSAFSTAAVPITPLDRGSLFRDPDGRRPFRRATVGVLGAEVSVPPGPATTFVLRKIEHQESVNISVLGDLARVNFSSNTMRRYQKPRKATSERRPLRKDAEFEQGTEAVKKLRQQFRTLLTIQLTNILHRECPSHQNPQMLSGEQAGAEKSDEHDSDRDDGIPQILGRQTARAVDQVAEPHKTLESIGFEVRHQGLIFNIALDVYQAITLGSVELDLVDEDEDVLEFLRREGRLDLTGQ